jgi:hypothetical protein
MWMMPNNRKRRQFNLGSVIGWLIFILVIAGGPIVNLLRRTFSGVIALPPNLSNWLPIAIGALVVLSIVVSALRALNNANSANRDARLPTDMSRPAQPPSTAMPPFGGSARGGPQRPPGIPSPRAFTPPSSPPSQRLSTPRFDPVINPVILAIGVVGLLALGGLALLLTQGGP